MPFFAPRSPLCAAVLSDNFSGFCVDTPHLLFLIPFFFSFRSPFTSLVLLHLNLNTPISALLYPVLPLWTIFYIRATRTRRLGCQWTIRQYGFVLLNCLIICIVSTLVAAIKPVIKETAVEVVAEHERLQERKSTSEITISSVPKHPNLLQERLLRQYNGLEELQLPYVETDFTAVPAGYVDFVWTRAVELDHRSDPIYTNGGYLPHLEILLELTDRNVDRPGVIRGNVWVSSSPGDLRDLHGRMDAVIAKLAAASPTNINRPKLIQRLTMVSFEFKKNVENNQANVPDDDAHIQAKATLYALDAATIDVVLVTLTDLQHHAGSYILYFFARDPIPGRTGPFLCEFQCSAATAIPAIKAFLRYSNTGQFVIPDDQLQHLSVDQRRSLRTIFDPTRFIKLSSLERRTGVRLPPSFANDEQSGNGGSSSGGNDGGSNSGGGNDGSSSKGANGQPSSASISENKVAGKGKGKGKGKQPADEANRRALYPVVINGSRMDLTSKQLQQVNRYQQIEALKRSQAYHNVPLHNPVPHFLLDQSDI